MWIINMHNSSGAALLLVVMISMQPSLSHGAIVNITTAIAGNKLNLATIEMTTPGGAANRVYKFNQLVLGSVTNYESIQEYASPGTTVSVLATPDPAPDTGSNRLDYVFDAALNTGLLNIGRDAPGLTVTFDRPIINRPGQEIVIFELTIGDGQLPDPLVVQSADGRGRSRVYGSGAYEFTGAIPFELTPTTYVVDVGQAGTCNLEELLNSTLLPSPVTNPKFHALAINLDALNIPEGESIQSLIIRTNSTAPTIGADILMVVAMQVVPEPSAFTLFIGGIGLFATRHGSRKLRQKLVACRNLRDHAS